LFGKTPLKTQNDYTF